MKRISIKSIRNTFSKSRDADHIEANILDGVNSDVLNAFTHFQQEINNFINLGLKEKGNQNIYTSQSADGQPLDLVVTAQGKQGGVELTGVLSVGGRKVDTLKLGSNINWTDEIDHKKVRTLIQKSLLKYAG